MAHDALARRNEAGDLALKLAGASIGRRAMCCVTGDAGARPPPPLPLPAAPRQADAAARLTPCQRAAYNSLVRAACAGYVPSVEVRGSRGGGRGQGATTILRALCEKLDLALLGASDALGGGGGVSATVADLLARGVEVVVVDDLDLASDAPRRLLAALSDACAARGACLVFATAAPLDSTALVVTIPPPQAADYAKLLENIGRADGVDVAALYDARPGLSPSRLRNLAARAQIQHAISEASGTLHLAPHNLLLALARGEARAREEEEAADPPKAP